MMLSKDNHGIRLRGRVVDRGRVHAEEYMGSTDGGHTWAAQMGDTHGHADGERIWTARVGERARHRTAGIAR